MTLESQQTRITVIGGGLAGCEAALQLAKRGIPVRLYDMKPHQSSPAHHSLTLAEIVCSNSFGSQGEGTASGLVKLEMMALGCELLAIAQSVAVPAGKALAVDRDVFTNTVTQRIQDNPYIDWIGAEITEIPTDADFVLIATGPMTSPGLIATIGKLVKRDHLYFFDAAAPIIARDSIDMTQAFIQDRYGVENDPTHENASYINCPLNEEQYKALVAAINDAERTELKSFEKEEAQYFESCLPIEVLASRGLETLRFGPFKPVGLYDPHTGKRPWAVVQLRQDNAEGSLYNMVGCQTNIKWGPQKTIIQMIPGLQDAEIVRYGVMHRNTYIHSPEVLLPTLELKDYPHILIAGQLTGTEGYTESIATGMLAAFNIARLVRGKAAKVPPADTMLGSLVRYITRPEAIGRDFQPINSNWGILPPLPNKAQFKKNKPLRNQHYAERALSAIQTWGSEMIKLDEWQIQHIQNALTAAKKEEFASGAELETFFNQYGEPYPAR